MGASMNPTVVYAADENYVPYAALSMESAMRYSSCPLDFVLLATGDVSADAVVKLKELFARYHDQGALRIIDMGDSFKEYDQLASHITYATCFRLLLPDLLPDIDRCLYVDCDTLVHGDLCELFSLPLDGLYFAGVPARGYYLKKEMHRERLGLTSEEFVYCNAGVLLMNLDKMRSDDVSARLVDALNNGWTGADQDALNAVCEGAIKELPLKYNAMVLYFDDRHASLKALVDPSEFEEAEQRPVIIHYACDTKPWNGGEIPFSDEWHRFAGDSVSGVLWGLKNEESTSMAGKKVIDHVKDWFRRVDR